MIDLAQFDGHELIGRIAGMTLPTDARYSMLVEAQWETAALLADCRRLSADNARLRDNLKELICCYDINAELRVLAFAIKEARAAIAASEGGA